MYNLPYHLKFESPTGESSNGQFHNSCNAKDRIKPLAVVYNIKCNAMYSELCAKMSKSRERF